jgi:hypothetical protein
LAIRSRPAPVPRRLSNSAGAATQLANEQRSRNPTLAKQRPEPEARKSASITVWDVRRPGRENMPASASPEPVQDAVPVPFTMEPELAHPSRSRYRLVPPRAGKRKRRSLCVEAGEARSKHLRRPVTIVVPTYGFAQQAISLREDPSRRNNVKRKMFCAMAKAHSEEGHSHSKQRRASEDLQKTRRVH